MKRLRKYAISGLLAALSGATPMAAMAEYVRDPIPYSTPLGSGPFKIVPSMDPSLPVHTIYSPSDFSVVGDRKLPVVVFGAIGCVDNGTRFRWFLSELASHGYLILANGRMGPLEEQIWPQPPADPPLNPPLPDPSEVLPAATLPAQMIEAIDWAIAENGRTGSPYFGRIDTSRIASMGMSCGGIQAIEVGADPRVTTTVVLNSGLFPDGTDRNVVAGGRALVMADLKRLHGSVAFISGDEADIAFGNAGRSFDYLQGVPAIWAYRRNTTHNETYGEPNGGDFGPVTLAWLDWRLKDDEGAGLMFTGADCGLCGNPKWVLKRKDLR